ncbi:type VI secretion system protein TssA, partial [Pseudoalteromonas sp. S1609]
AWLNEGLSRVHGFIGNAFGISVAMHELEHHIESLNPTLEDRDEISDKGSALYCLNGSAGAGRLIIPIK